MIHQILRLIKTHTYVAFFTFVFGMLFLASIVTTKTGGFIFSLLATLIYFFAIYNTSFDICKQDKKSYTKTMPHKLKGLVLPVGVLAVSILLYLLYIISWNFISIGKELISVTAWINNILFIMWSFMYNSFINLYQGNMSLFGYIIIAVLPFVASALGYYAGYVDFDINEKFLKMVYEKKNTEGK